MEVHFNNADPSWPVIWKDRVQKAGKHFVAEGLSMNRRQWCPCTQNPKNSKQEYAGLQIWMGAIPHIELGLRKCR